MTNNPVLDAVGGLTSAGEYPAYAWPGGYEIGYVFDDGEICCAACLNTEAEASEDADAGGGWRIVGWVTSDVACAAERDGELECCAHCGQIWPQVDRDAYEDGKIS